MSIKVFNKNKPSMCFIDQIYDPNIHGEGDLAEGKIIPHEGSGAIDRETGVIYYVSFVDPHTFESTLKPATYFVSEDGEVDYVSYNNDKFALYFDDRVKPTQLCVDQKLVMFGRDLAEYRIVQELEDGTKRVISVYYNSDGEIISDKRIPMRELSGEDGAKLCTNCHTLFPMVEGDRVTIEVFNKVGQLKGHFTAFTKRSTIQNDLSSPLDPITQIKASCLQEMGDDWYIYERQSVEHLGITVELFYANGGHEIVPVDNQKCIIYGLDHYAPAYPGYEREVLIKYYLSPRESSTVSDYDSHQRYVWIKKKLIVIPNKTDYSVKISTVPHYNRQLQKWELSFFAYTDRKDDVVNVTNMVSIDEGTPFDGQKFNVFQHINVSLDVASIFNVSTSIPYQQGVWVKLRPHGAYEKYVIQDSPNPTFAYGVEGGGYRRPVIHYDISEGQYFIPTSVFTNKEAVIQSFYTFALPPYNRLIEVEPEVPTHYTVRDYYSGNTIVAAPIPLEQFDQAWNPITLGEPDKFVGDEVVVEFLREHDGNFNILYGVPVSVTTTGTAYNTENNVIYT